LLDVHFDLRTLLRFTTAGQARNPDGLRHQDRQGMSIFDVFAVFDSVFHFKNSTLVIEFLPSFSWPKFRELTKIIEK
jgi:hypothetical protein